MFFVKKKSHSQCIFFDCVENLIPGLISFLFFFFLNDHYCIFSPSQYRIPQSPADSMTLYLCLPLLVALLHPAQCLYNCSSVYERTPGRKLLGICHIFC